MIDMDDVRAKLQQVYDPEIGVNVVDLGLIYKMEEREEGSLYIEMTMTTPGCPAHDMISENVEWAAAQASGVAMVYVDVVWDPPWSPEMMSIDARRELGFI
ncbi:hypothetical protein Alches_28330 [Alicyclobacillus hesperidum subsp. aegles]|nr:aromatic ring hydroxylase [Alicyclobacillus tengchongensis]GLG02792.1 hypothetical protein Alches_28330 [Alicyclobacillus hesperidum subsp. aegles]